MAVIQAACTCGTKVEIRTGSDSNSDFRADGKQAVYPGGLGHYIFRCRDCLQPLHETVAEFAYEAESGW